MNTWWWVLDVNEPVDGPLTVFLDYILVLPFHVHVKLGWHFGAIGFSSIVYCLCCSLFACDNSLLLGALICFCGVNLA